MSTRLMAKTFDVEKTEKGSPLQSKINQFTNGKAITEVHDLAVKETGDHVQAALVYSVDDSDGATSPRILSKVIEAPLSSELQTKVNSFTKGKALDVKKVSVLANGDHATVVLLYSKEGGGDEE